MDPVIADKEREYREYVDEHRANVWKAFQNILQIPSIKEEIIKAGCMQELMNRCLEHDMSKYEKEEFEPYRQYHSPTCEEEKNIARDKYGEAWKHHYTVNDHHWNHWVDENNEPREMSIPALFELVCDWTGMGYKFGNDAYQYYQENKDNIIMHPNTRSKLESILTTIHFTK